MSDLIDELRILAETNIAASNRTLTVAADALESQAKRIAELEPQADAYNFACEDMEKFQRERFEAGKEVGTQGSLCDGMAWVYGRLSELEAEVARLRVDGWFPANLANVPTGDMRRKVLSYWSSGTVEGKYTAEELAYHIAAHAKHGDHFVVAKAWAEYPTAAIDAAKESA